MRGTKTLNGDHSIMNKYARQFSEILPALSENHELRDRVLQLIRSEPIPGKVLEGEGRTDTLRTILIDLVDGEGESLEGAVFKSEERLDRNDSVHASDNRVFASGWSERLMRTQLSRFYNQAVLLQLTENDAGAECFVPHTDIEHSASKCSAEIAGRWHQASTMLSALVENYSEGNWSKEPKIPEHPHCSHVVAPLESIG